jgi:hypothetical protein
MRYTKLYYDMEVYPNYWCIVIYDGEDVTSVSSDDDYSNLIDYLWEHKDDFLYVAYNSKKYDRYILELLMRYGKVDKKEDMCQRLYVASKLIIEKDFNGRNLLAYYSENDLILPADLDYALGIYYKWENYKKQRKEFWQSVEDVTSTPQLDVADFNGKQLLGLKELMIRIHFPTIETLPYKSTIVLNGQQKQKVLDYCINDVAGLYALCERYYHSEIMARENLINGFNLPLENFIKTDTAIVEELLCDYSVKPTVERFKYKPPLKFDFKSPQVKDLYETYQSIWFDDNTTFTRTVQEYGLKITFGLGGLHAETIKRYVLPKGKKLIDIDFASYYPYLIKRFKYLPPTVKDPKMFYDMIDERVALKSTNPKLAEAYKIVINRAFGAMNLKIGNYIGQLYDLRSFYGVTITGQFLLMALVEGLTLLGFTVVYANTDGIMVEVDVDYDAHSSQLREACDEFSELIDIQLEFKEYKEGLIRDVNNYILKGKDVKAKGDYKYSIGSKRHAFAMISLEAMITQVFQGKPIDETIRECRDLRKFICFQKYGRQYFPTSIEWENGFKQPFDRVVRYYLSANNRNQIRAWNTNTGSKIDRELSDNVQIIPDISDFYENDWFPEDIDYDRYIEYAYKLLQGLTDKDIIKNDYILGILEELKECFIES